MYTDEHVEGLNLSPAPGPPPQGEGDPPWVFLYEFEAATWEEACAIYHLRQGFEPYKPDGEPAECPVCKAMYYPEGSGVCWRGHGRDPAKEDAGSDPQNGDAQRQGS